MISCATRTRLMQASQECRVTAGEMSAPLTSPWAYRLGWSATNRWLTILLATFVLVLLLTSSSLLAGSADLSGSLLGGPRQLWPTGFLEAPVAPAISGPNSPDVCDGHLALDFTSPVTAGAIDVLSEQDCYTFDAVAGDTVRVVVNESSGTLTAQWEIQDSGTNTVCGPSTNLEQDCLISTTGTYTIFIWDFLNNDTGGYRVKLLRLNNPAGCGTTALDLAFTSPVTVGSIVAMLEHDCYTFDAVAGDKVRVVVNESSGTLNPQWEIQDSNTNTICGPSTNIEQDCLLSATGTYTMLIWDFLDNDTGGYRVKLLRLNDPAGCGATALDLGFTSPVTAGSIVEMLEHDCYAFDAVAGDTVRVVVDDSSGTLNPQWEIQDSSTNTICGPSTNIEQDCLISGTGTYTLLIWDFLDNDTGGYRVKLLRLNNPAGCGSTALDLTFTSPVTAGSIVAILEHDCYTFDAVAGDTVRVVVNKSSGTLNSQWEIQDNNTNIVCGPSTNIEQDCLISATGTYTMLIWDFLDNDTGGYRVKLLRLNDPAGCGSTALDLAFTSPVTAGSIVEMLEHDCHTFDAVAGDKVRVVIDDSSGTLDPQWEIQDSGTNTICGQSTALEEDCLIPATGTYTLLIWDFLDNDTGGYRVKLLRLNNAAGCTPFWFSVPQVGSIGATLEHDCYSFEAGAGHQVRIVVDETSGSLTAQWELLNSATDTACGPTTAGQVDCTIPAGGTYTLVVWDFLDNHTGGYNLNVICLSCSNSADLDLDISDAPDPATVGEPLTYLLSVSNNGSVSATGVNMTDTLPAGVTFASAVPSQGDCSMAAGKVTCELGAILNSATVTVTIVVTPTVKGAITNAAVVHSDVIDPDHRDNMASVQTTVKDPDDEYLTYLPYIAKP